MSKQSSTALGLTVAIALTTGSVLVEPSNTDQAPGAYSDITIAEADNQKIPPEEAAPPPPPQVVVPANPPSADVPPAVETTPGEESKGVPPRKP